MRAQLTALEALLVEFQSGGDALFGGVHGFGALGALGDLGWNERHLEYLAALLLSARRRQQRRETKQDARLDANGACSAKQVTQHGRVYMCHGVMAHVMQQ